MLLVEKKLFPLMEISLSFCCGNRKHGYKCAFYFPGQNVQNYETLFPNISLHLYISP